MSAARFATLLLSALCLSACAATAPGEAVGRYPAADDRASGERPLASLPPAAGRVVAVRGLSYVNGIGQEIVLEGPRAMLGENRITVQTLTTSRTGGRGQAGDELKLVAPSIAAITGEMERQLPGMTMEVVAAPERDAAGPIAYATGTKGRLSCIYAWQSIASDQPLSFFEGASDTGSLPVSVRVRLCREQPLSTLIDDLRGLQVMPPSGDLQPARSAQASSGDALDVAIGRPPAPSARDGIGGAEPDAAGPLRRVSRRHTVQHRMTSHRRTAIGAKLKVVTSRAPVLPRLPVPDEVQASQAPRRPPADTLPLPLPASGIGAALQANKAY